MCSVDETSEREMKGSEDITHAGVIDSRLIYLEKISFFVRDNHNFLKVFEIHLPWWYFETLYNEIPSYHRPKLFFTSEFLFVGERKKKRKRKTLKTFKNSLFPLKNFFCHFSKNTIDASTNHRMYNLLAAISRANPTWNHVPGFHITEIFVPFQEPRLLDNAATRRRLRVSRTLSNPRVRSFHEPFTRRIERNTASRPENKEKRRSAARFVEIRANFSYDFKRSW